MLDEYAKSRVAGLDRRQFLALTSTVAVGSMFAGSAGASTVLGVATRRDSPLSVGFLAGSEDWPDLSTLPWNRQGVATAPDLDVLSAEALSVGDQNLAGGVVEMCVLGLVPRIPRRQNFDFHSANLIVFHPSPIPGAVPDAPFVAWGLRRNPALSRSARTRVRFRWPLRDDGGLVVALELCRRLPGGLLETTRFSTDFTVDWYPGRPKLQRGLYLLALKAGAWQNTVHLPGQGAPPRDELCSLAISFEPVARDAQEE